MNAPAHSEAAGGFGDVADELRIGSRGSIDSVNRPVGTLDAMFTLAGVCAVPHPGERGRLVADRAMAERTLRRSRECEDRSAPRAQPGETAARPRAR
jgi:hypothetical protein